MTIIAAITRDRALGRGGDMIYHISADLRRFKQLTMGHPIIMGRKTFESFPNGPLPGRRNIVISRNTDYHPDGAEVVNDYELLINNGEGSDTALLSRDEEAFIIGGGQIYKMMMPYADRLCMTEIDADTDDADTFFPEIDPDVWQQVDTSEWHTDPRSGVRFRYVDYIRK